MTKLEQETDRITPEALKAFMESERYRMTVGPGNICSRTHAIGVEHYDPFQKGKYPYLRELGNLSGKPWSEILRQSPEELIPANPFEVSRKRGPGHSQLWDAGIGIPACAHRKFMPTDMRGLIPMRNTNTHWITTMHRAVNAAGMEINGKSTRIAGPWIFDLTTMGEYGWFLAEAMHTWAHYRADFKKNSANNAQVDSNTMGRLQQALGLLAVSHYYGLPLFVGEEGDETKAYPYFRHYGIDLKTTTNFSLPAIGEPWMGNEAPRFDHTLATIVVAIRIEPPPLIMHGIATFRDEDRWAGFPTMAAIVGWERMDMTLHQPLVSYHPDDPNAMKCYGLHPADLLPPETFWNFLKLGRQARGLPPTDEQNMTFEAWMQSPQYLQRYIETPPRPCATCIAWQRKSEAYIKRPGKREPDSAQKAYKQKVLLFRKAVRKAEREYQVKIYGSPAARNRINKERNQHFREKLANDRQKKILQDAKWKISQSKQLTDRQTTAYSAYRTEVRKRKELECTTLALTTESVVPSESSPQSKDLSPSS